MPRYILENQEIIDLLSKYICTIFPELAGKSGRVSLRAKDNKFTAEFTEEKL